MADAHIRVRFPLSNTPHGNNILFSGAFGNLSRQVGRMLQSCSGLLQEFLDLLIAEDYGPSC